MASSPQSTARQGPPYTSHFQMLGETPSVVPDVPVNVIFLLLFTFGAIGHAWQYRINILLGRKFIPNAAAFAFCITRIFTTILWIVWACNPKSIECEVAALIFGYVGIIALFIVNLIFSRRIVRGQHPHFGWTMLFSIPFTVLFLIVVATIICLIVAIVLEFSTQTPSALHSALVIQRYGATLYAIIGFLPIVIVGISSLVRQHPKVRNTKTVDKFGEGSMRTKVLIVVVTALLLSLGACYRAGTILAPRVPVGQPEPSYLSKACFYIFTFTIEFLTVLFWLIIRIDRRFYVPDGAWGPHSYAGGFVFAGEPGNEKGGNNAAAGARARDSQRSIIRSDSSSAEPYKSWLGGLRVPLKTFNDYSSSSTSRLSRRSEPESTDPSSVAAADLRPPPPRARSLKRVSSRISTHTAASFSSRASSRRRARTLARESAISWGGVSREAVCDSLGEAREIVPYPGFSTSEVAMPSPVFAPESQQEQVSAADVGVAGVDKEMGFDPKTGKWALRPVSRDKERGESSRRGSWSATFGGARRGSVSPGVP